MLEITRQMGCPDVIKYLRLQVKRFIVCSLMDFIKICFNKKQNKKCLPCRKQEKKKEIINFHHTAG